jgi:tetratricopeptide (TPR) repeat protein
MITRHHTCLHLVGLILGVLALGGCGSAARPSAYLDESEVSRDIAAATALYQEALPKRSADPAAAERLLRKALVADLYHGPAHNDLGVLLLNQGRIYDAAFEFTWARKLLPGHPDPRLNLAIALDRGGKVEEAMAAAQAALEVRPGYLPAVQALASYQVRARTTDAQTPVLLAAIIEQSEDPTWRSWAERQQIRLSSAPLE